MYNTSLIIMLLRRIFLFLIFCFYNVKFAELDIHEFANIDQNILFQGLLFCLHVLKITFFLEKYKSYGAKLWETM